MTMYASTAPHEQHEDNNNKDSCNFLGCQEKATEQLVLPLENTEVLFSLQNL